MKNIAIIPARSGSKGIKNKNIVNLCGKPLLAYSILAAVKSNLFDEVMVSTDSKEYANIAIAYGAHVPFLRSKKNATDVSNKWDAINEVLQQYGRQDYKFDTFCVLQPTSPLRTGEDIIHAYDVYKNKNAIAVISVCPAEHSPAWCNLLPENNSMKGFISEEADSQRQKITAYYRLNGAIYIMNTSEFYKNRYPYREQSYAYVMPPERSVDIDTYIDLKLAELMMGINQSGWD